MKFHAALPEHVLLSLDAEVAAGHYPSRSAALIEAIVFWREARLEAAYRSAFSAVDSAWDESADDGWVGESAGYGSSSQDSSGGEARL